MEADLEELGIDRRDILELVMELEKETGVELSLQEIPGAVGDLVTLLTQG